MSDVSQLAGAARAALEAATTVAELEQAKVEHLGRSAPLVMMLRDVGWLPPEQRATVGKEGNIARRELEGLCESRMSSLALDELNRELANDATDVTLPARSIPTGSLHLLTQTRRAIEENFLGMGYRVVDGPEVESEYYNFTALNTPEGHPARTPSDTFYIDGEPDVLLRTQTSPVQVRTMQQEPPPLYVISPGRVYRRDTIDATHSDMFHQVEGLAVDEGITLSDLKGTLQAFCRAFFGENVDIRLRTHFFPFTEPSVEIDLSCYRCGGTGEAQSADDPHGRCRLCKGIGWIEIMGAGMVDPNVFSYVDGYDPNVISGFAFGMGVDRITVLRHELPDMRLLFQNDLRFLSQFAGQGA